MRNICSLQYNLDLVTLGRIELLFREVRWAHYETTNGAVTGFAVVQKDFGS